MAAVATDPHSTYPKPAVAWCAVAVLMLAYTFSFIDRLILSLLVEPIKQDLGLSDVQISLVQGFSFALFYTLAGIPVGGLVDSRGRTTIIAIGIALWSTMTAITALAPGVPLRGPAGSPGGTLDQGGAGTDAALFRPGR